jgi:hypothetical protein
MAKTRGSSAGGRQRGQGAYLKRGPARRPPRKMKDARKASDPGKESQLRHIGRTEVAP